MSRAARWICCTLLLATLACRGGGEREPQAAAQPNGLVVERVSPGGAAALAGIEVGDVLVSWRRTESSASGAAAGAFARAFDVHRVEVLHGAAGAVTMVVSRPGDRGPVAREVVLSGAAWRMWARPTLDPAAEQSLRATVASIDEDDPETARAAAAALERLGVGLARPDERVAVAVLAGRLVRELLPGEDPSPHFERALEAAEASGDQTLVAWASHEAGWAAQQARRLADALRHHERALELYRRTEPGSLLEANALQETALLRAQLGELEPAVAALEEVLAARRSLAPESLGVAATLNNLGNYVSDLAEQERYHEEALALRERLAPGSLDVAASLNNLGNVAWARGDLGRAERLLGRAGELLAELDAPPRFRGGVAGNLALVARERGDFAGAELYALEALRVFERHEPKGPFHAEALNTLGIVRRARGDLRGAEASFREVLELARGIEQTSPRTVNALLNLGGTLIELERPEAAAEALREAAALQERLDPHGVSMAAVWTLLANVARERGDHEEEEPLLRAALARWEEQAPESLLVARALDHLGELHLREHRLAQASAAFERAFSFAASIAPGTRDEARFAHHLARVRREQGRIDEALALFDRAAAALESQLGMVGGGDETRTQFRDTHRELYREHVELLLESGRAGEAFAALERSRSQAFVAMLAERDLVFRRELSEELDARRGQLEREYDRTLGRLIGVSARESPQEAAALRARLAELRREHEALVTELRADAPQLAALRYPEPPTLAGLAAGLSPGSLLLEYLVGPRSSTLFVLASDGSLAVYELGIGEEELDELVDRFLLLLRASPDPDGTGQELDRSLGELGAELYRQLLGPAAERLASAERIVLVPDGPLHVLPFGALVDRDSGAFLLERFAYTVTPSAAALEAAAERSAVGPRAGSRAVRAVAFGDPASDAATPLPWARAEVDAIERALGGRVRTLVGRQATEETVDSLEGEIDYLHFAVHGRLDARAPLDSALVLATGPGSQRNGLLQAWEVLERVRVDAELAVLSGCETALGEERSGEGLVGLVRAFHFAGARSVVASLWRVSDRTTAVLMARLYHHLDAGATPSEALRAAQLELLRGAPEALDAFETLGPGGFRRRVARWLGRSPAIGEAELARMRHPATWATFQVYGSDQ